MTAKVKCMICPKGCLLGLGEVGDCRVRQNVDGAIQCMTYGQPCSMNVDPIEKKPLYHFLPGSPIFSIGTPGCNLHCKPCQNWQISQSNRLPSLGTFSPQEVVDGAVARDCSAIAYTYTEPLVSYEYTHDCCQTAHEKGIKNVLVTAAFINPDPLREICKYVDAANVDLKSFSDDFYRSVCGARLQPVLEALKVMKECGVMLEITNLMVPTLNDAEDETRQLCDWVVENLGAETPLHFSRFFPQNQLKNLPPTPEETLLQARQIAMRTGLEFVYIGNMQNLDAETTWCPGCYQPLIERAGYQILRNRIKNGRCSDCSTPIVGIWQ